MSARRLFLSHAGEESVAARALARRLRDAGLEVWLDVDELKPGDRWMANIEQALRAADAFAVYVGRSGIQRWVDREVRVALERSTADPRFRLIPILGPGADPRSLPIFLAQHQWVDFRQETTAEDLLRLIGAVMAAEPAAISLLPPDEAPFRGLQSFDVDDAHLFFGRDREIEELLDRLRLAPFLAVVGDSGSGKSSLVRAGVVPALHRGRFHDGVSWAPSWRIAIFRPDEDPFRELANALPGLDPFLSAEERIRVRAECARQLERGVDGLASCAAALVPTGSRTLVVVDQFEEVFDRAIAASERRRLVDSLLRALGGSGDRPVHVLITLRADFYARCWEHPELPKRVAGNQYAVQAIGPTELRDVVERPLAMAGARCEPGLVDAILADAGSTTGSLPLLQHVLLQLWHRHRDRSLTHQAYQDIGRLPGAIRQHADTVYEHFDESQKEIARKVFLRLTQPGPNPAEDTRRSAVKSELLTLGGDAPAVEAVLDRLIDSRLVTVRRGAGDDQLEVPHEALIRQWPRLRTWLEPVRDGLRVERRFMDAVAEWVSLGRDPGALYRGARLREAKKWVEAHWGDRSADEREFFQASVEAYDEEARRERRRRWWLAATILFAAYFLNAAYALTPAYALDFRVVPPLLVLVTAFRFGKLWALFVAAIAAGPWVVPSVLSGLGGRETGWLYHRTTYGPLLIPHSSVSDLVRLLLLAYCAGWLCETVQKAVAAHGVSFRRTTGASALDRPPRPVRDALGTGAAAIVTFLANLSVPPWTLPGLSLLACAGLGYRLGPRRGAQAGALAMLASTVASAFLVPGQLEFHTAGHILAFALLGYGAGRARRVLQQPEALYEYATRLGLLRREAVPVRLSLAILVPLLLLASVVIRVDQPPASLWLHPSPVVTALVILTGACTAPRAAAWATGVTIGVVGIVARAVRRLAWLPPWLVLEDWSSVYATIWAAAAYLAGRADLVGSRKNRYLFAIGVFAALQLSLVLRRGFFPSTTFFVRGRVGDFHLELFSATAMLLEPLLTVFLLEAAFKRLGVDKRAP